MEFQCQNNAIPHHSLKKSTLCSRFKCSKASQTFVALSTGRWGNDSTLWSWRQNIPALAVNGTPADALAPKVARASAGMVLAVKDRYHVSLFQTSFHLLRGGGEQQCMTTKVYLWAMLKLPWNGQRKLLVRQEPRDHSVRATCEMCHNYFWQSRLWLVTRYRRSWSTPKNKHGVKIVSTLPKYT